MFTLCRCVCITGLLRVIHHKWGGILTDLLCMCVCMCDFESIKFNSKPPYKHLPERHKGKRRLEKPLGEPF